MRAVILDQNGPHFTNDFDPTQAVEVDEVPVSVLVAGICETDLQLIRGYMDFRGVLGHEFVGIARQGRYAGQRVVGEINCACRQCEICNVDLQNHCPHRRVIGILDHDGAFAEQLFMPESNLHVVPDALTNDVAVFTEPLAAAFQIPRQIDISQHRTAAVLGDGRLGFLVAQVLRFNRCDVTVIGKHARKLENFEAAGFTTKHISETESRRHSLVVDCTGSITGVPSALRFLCPCGTLVLKTTISGKRGPPLAQVVIDEITVVGSRCGPFDIALGALERQEIQVESMITGRFPLEQAETAFRAAASDDHQKVLFDIV